MSQIISQAEKDKLYTQVFHLLGMPVRGIELTEEQMDTFMELALSEYEQYVSDWLIESQWSALAGLDIDTQSLSRAFTTRSLDYETQYTHSYSKIVGLQAGGDWELKKDYFTLSGETQVYEIPAGREVNELLWFARAELSDSFVDPFMSGFGGLGGLGFGGAGGSSCYTNANIDVYKGGVYYGSMNLYLTQYQNGTDALTLSTNGTYTYSMSASFGCTSGNNVQLT